MIAEISRLNGFQNGGRKPYWIFESQNFQRLGWLRNLFCTSKPNFVKTGQTIAEIWWFFSISKMAAAKLKKWTFHHQLLEANGHHQPILLKAKLLRLRFNGFQCGGCPPSFWNSSHTRTVVRECCKGNDQSLWERGKFDPPPHKNLSTDGHQNLCRWLRRWSLPPSKILSKSV